MLNLERVRLGFLSDCTLAIESGLHVILGAPSDGTRELIDALAGSAAPHSGKVRILGQDPRRAPSIRKQLACLRAEEELFPSRTLGQAVESALLARGVDVSAEAALSSVGLSRWAQRDPRGLLPAERRSVAACIAFAMQKPLLAILHEPLAYLPGISADRVQAQIRTWLEQERVVVCTTSSSRAAHALGGTVWLMNRGQVLRGIAAAEAIAFAPGGSLTLLVRTRSPRELARALAKNSAISALNLDEAKLPFEVRVQGSDASAVALAVCQALVDEKIDALAIVPVVPDLELAQAANVGYLRGAYESGYRAAFGPMPAPPGTP
jgi:ABC-type multidrug transport system ATPase subunit